MTSRWAAFAGAALLALQGPALSLGQADAPAVDPATIPMPNISFTPTSGDERDFDKYFFFHRPDTDFATAYADLRECDRYSGGVRYMAGYRPPTSAMGGLLPALIGESERQTVANGQVVGPTQRRRRRVNMRTCMEFKGYGTYGIPKSLWLAFNFDEKTESVEGAERQHYLQLQARVASGPTPQTPRLEQ
jgi:hypothetical protein